MSRPVTVWRPRQSSELSARVCARSATRRWSKEGTHSFQSRSNSGRIRQSFFYSRRRRLQSAQREQCFVFDNPLDRFPARELQGLSDGGRKVDVPLFAGFAFDELHFGGKSHAGEGPFVISSYITRYNDTGKPRTLCSKNDFYLVNGQSRARYFVAQQQDLSSATSPKFLIRTATGTAPVLAAVRQAFRRVDPTLPIESANSIEEQMVPLTAQDRTTAQLAIVFGSVALLLAAIGLYGVLSYGIARRTGEIAVRIALGARPRRVIAMILRETSGLVIAGMAAGAGLAYGVSRLIMNGSMALLRKIRSRSRWQACCY